MSMKLTVTCVVATSLLIGCVPNRQTPQLPEPVQKASVQMEAPLDANSPNWRVGDQWQWSDGYGLEVSEVSGNRTMFKRTDAKKQWVQREGFFKVDSQSSTARRTVVFRTRDPMEIFPLTTGNRSVFKREYLSNGKLREHRTSWMVEGREVIRVPAGQFDCWILVMRTRGINSDWTGYEKWWYSPVAKNFVRMEFRYGAAPSSSRVLTSYKIDTLTQ